MTDPVYIVTCFITRPGDQGIELLLFNHLHAGVQIPAGMLVLGVLISIKTFRWE